MGQPSEPKAEVLNKTMKPIIEITLDVGMILCIIRAVLLALGWC